jgi:Flp pilus assembly protein TadG
MHNKIKLTCAKRAWAKRARQFFKWPTARRFVRRQDGSAAVEFALVLLPFLALLFAIIQTALVFLAQQTLETVTASAARLILTGQAQSQGLTQTTFKNAVCADVVALFNCASGININVQTFSSFSNVSTPTLISNGQFQNNNFVFQPGGPGDIVVVQIMYQWPIFVNLLGSTGLANLGNNDRLLVATAAFRNEPYGSSSR